MIFSENSGFMVLCLCWYPSFWILIVTARYKKAVAVLYKCVMVSINDATFLVLTLLQTRLVWLFLQVHLITDIEEQRSKDPTAMFKFLTE